MLNLNVRCIIWRHMLGPISRSLFFLYPPLTPGNWLPRHNTNNDGEEVAMAD